MSHGSRKMTHSHLLSELTIESRFVTHDPHDLSSDWPLTLDPWPLTYDPSLLPSACTRIVCCTDVCYAWFKLNISLSVTLFVDNTLTCFARARTKIKKNVTSHHYATVVTVPDCELSAHHLSRVICNPSRVEIRSIYHGLMVHGFVTHPDLLTHWAITHYQDFVYGARRVHCIACFFLFPFPTLPQYS